MKLFQTLFVLFAIAMPSQSYAAGPVAAQVTVASTATLIKTGSGDGGNVAIKNLDASAAVYIGGATVTTSNGYKLAAGDTVVVQLRNGDVVYGIVASSTAVVSVVDRVNAVARGGGGGGLGTVTTSGSPSSGDCSFFTGASAISGDAACAWDNTAKALQLGTASNVGLNGQTAYTDNGGGHYLSIGGSFPLVKASITNESGTPVTIHSSDFTLVNDSVSGNYLNLFGSGGTVAVPTVLPNGYFPGQINFGAWFPGLARTAGVDKYSFNAGMNGMVDADYSDPMGPYQYDAPVAVHLIACCDENDGYGAGLTARTNGNVNIGQGYVDYVGLRSTATGILQVVNPETPATPASVKTAGLIAPTDTLNVSAELTAPDGSVFTPVLAGAGAGNVDNGVHHYKFALHDYISGNTTQAGTASPAVTVVDKTVNGQVFVQFPESCSSPSHDINIYRDANDGVYKLVQAAVACGFDNDLFTDNVANADLGAVAPTTNTTMATRLSVIGQSLVPVDSSAWWGNSITRVIGLGLPGDDRVDFVAAPGTPSHATGTHVFIQAGTSLSGDGGNIGLVAGTSTSPTDSYGTVTLAGKNANLDGSGNLYLLSLKSHGAATGKKVVCADESNGRLYLSSTGTDCSN